MWKYIIGGEYPLNQMSRTKFALELPWREKCHEIKIVAHK